MKKISYVSGLLAILMVFSLPAAAPAFDVGPFSIGGAMRVNYTLGDYVDELGRSSRSENDNGAFALDTFRINVDFEKNSLIGKAEYRFYPGYGPSNHDSYHFPHTGWVGYNFDNDSQIQVGLNRVPFGPTAYGISQSWMFDQHFYVGLADDMDLGIKYTLPLDGLTLDFAYYASDEGTHNGANFSDDSVRYSYDVVDETDDGYEERNQANLRAIYSLEAGSVNTDLGVSLQYGQLKSNGDQDDGDMMAASVHAVATFGNFKLAPQVTWYEYDVDEDQPLGTDKLVQMGAFDFPTLVAAEAYIPAVSLSYTLQTPQVDWLDYVVPYVEYSTIEKAEDEFNDSEMFVVGSAWANGGWYIYTDLAYSNGNDFVGNESGYGANPAPGFASNRLGANPNHDWEYRFNINFGYYF